MDRWCHNWVHLLQVNSGRSLVNDDLLLNVSIPAVVACMFVHVDVRCEKNVSTEEHHVSVFIFFIIYI